MTSFTKFDPRAFLEGEKNQKPGMAAKAAKTAKAEDVNQPGTPAKAAKAEDNLAGLAGLAGGVSQSENSIPNSGSASDRGDRSAESPVAGTDPRAPCELKTNGTGQAHIRSAGSQCSPPLPVRPPSFETPSRFSLPVCTGWCSGCGTRSTWRASPVPNASGQRWQCVRCGGSGETPQARGGRPRHVP